jgi:hypothetical protein
MMAFIPRPIDKQERQNHIGQTYFLKLGIDDICRAFKAKIEQTTYA